MSTKNWRKRKLQSTQQQSNDGRKSKNKRSESSCNEIEESDALLEKAPLVASDGKVFYPCQFCSKIFASTDFRDMHMNICTNKLYIFNVEDFSKKLQEEEEALKNSKNNNTVSVKQRKRPIYECDKVSFGNKKNSSKTSASIYDFDVDEFEEDIKQPLQNNTIDSTSTVNTQPSTTIEIRDDNEVILDSEKEETEDQIDNNRKCKHCHQIFDTPLAQLRHSRDCNTFPRTMVPVAEVEKYFDLADRGFCPICQKPIKTRNFRSVYIKHLLVHTTGLTHECAVCKKKFRRRDHMRTHEKRHV